MKKKALIMMALLVGSTMGWAENVTFTVCSWDDTNKQVVKTPTTHDCIVIEGQDDGWMALGETDKETWYVVKSFDYVSRDVLNIFGTVHLVLTEYSSLSCHHIKLEAQNNAKLHIHNVSGDASGNIEVKNWYDQIINQGVVGYHHYYRYYYGAAAVGGGNGQNMGSLYMHGGTLYASIQDERPAAIGGGREGSIDLNHEIVVYAGVLKGETVFSDHINQLEPRGAAIGGSDDHPQGGSITVYGGTLWAKCNTRGAGIGGGEDSYGGTFNVYGGNVKVERNTAGDKLGNQTSKNSGAGIGGGYEGSGGDVHIYGGTIDVVGGERHYAIGGYDNDGKGTIEIAANMRVTAGGYDYNTGTASPECVFTSAERVPACMYRRWAKVEVCDHTPQNGDAPDVAATYSIVSDTQHDRYCRYCQAVIREDHAAGECPCGNTGYSFTTYEPSSMTGGSGYQQKQTYRVNENNDFYLPECDVVPTGYKFLGWEMNPAPEDADKWAAVKGGDAGSDNKLAAGTSVKALQGMSNATFYARYLYDFKAAWQWNADNTKCTLILSCDAKPNWTYQVVLTQNNAIVREYLTDCLEYSISYTYTDNANGYKYKFSTKKRVPYVLTLQDDADNSAAIKQYKGKTATVSLTGRTLYTDGKWNTLCLPFDVDASDFSGLNFKAVKTLVSSQFNNATGTLTLNFGDAEKIEAGKPYLVRWGSGEEGNIVDYEFEPAVIDNTLRPIETAYVDFVGSFSPVSLAGGDKTVLYIAAGNKLYYPQADKTIGSCRALFRLKINETEARSFVLNFGEETTAVFDLNDKSEMINDNWYSLDGRRLSGKPTQRGMYINNGKKVVIK